MFFYIRELFGYVKRGPPKGCHSGYFSFRQIGISYDENPHLGILNPSDGICLMEFAPVANDRKPPYQSLFRGAPSKLVRASARREAACAAANALIMPCWTHPHILKCTNTSGNVPTGSQVSCCLLMHMLLLHVSCRLCLEGGACKSGRMKGSIIAALVALGCLSVSNAMSVMEDSPIHVLHTHIRRLDETIVLKVNGITRDFYATRIKQGLANVKGVTSVDITVADGVGTATIVGSASAETLIAAVAAEGDKYSAEVAGCRRRRQLHESEEQYKRRLDECATIVLTVGGLTRDFYATRIQQALEHVKGVTSVDIALADGVGTVTVVGSATADVLIAAVTAEGSKYTAEVACRRRRRRLEVYSTTYPGTVDSWKESWGNSLSCWWENTPLQASLRDCSATLTEVVSERFDSAKGHGGMHAQVAEPRCEWVKALDDRLQLPSFPSFGGLPEFQLPVQLLPWGVQKWQEMGDQSAVPSWSSSIQSASTRGSTVPQATATTATDSSFSWVGFGLGAAGMSSGAMVAFALSGRKRSRAVPTASPNKGIDMSAMHAKACGSGRMST